MYVCSENQQDNDICGWLKLHKCSFELAFMYRSISNDITPLFQKKGFEIICFFTPSGVKSLFDNFPDFKQNKIVIALLEVIRLKLLKTLHSAWILRRRFLNELV